MESPSSLPRGSVGADFVAKITYSVENVKLGLEKFSELFWSDSSQCCIR